MINRILRFSGYKRKENAKCAKFKFAFLCLITLAICILSVLMSLKITLILAIFYIMSISYRFIVTMICENNHIEKIKELNRAKTVVEKMVTQHSGYFYVVLGMFVVLAILYIVAISMSSSIDLLPILTVTVIIGIIMDFFGNIINNVIMAFGGEMVIYFAK